MAPGINSATIVAGLSGGVDSSVAAYRAMSAGAVVVGASLRLLPAGLDAAHDAALISAEAVALQLGIEYEIIDATGPFDTGVLDYVADSYARGLTPNPCTRCNEEVKFALLLRYADTLGADLVVTGHYARVLCQGDRRLLARGVDSNKDQSYFLYRLGPDVLSRIDFPVGEMSKDEVRLQAAEFGMHTSDRQESQDACFALGVGVADFVIDRKPEAGGPGEILRDGQVIGTHDGIARFTVGQRKGLGIGGDGPLYVSRIDSEDGSVHVAPMEESRSTSLHAERAVWYSSQTDIECDVQIRHRMNPARARVRIGGSGLDVTFAEPVFAPAPGQSVVCYERDIVLGGGEICA